MCNFIFGSMYMCLLTDTVDVELTISKVKGIYTYCKDHTEESTIFSPWSKSVIPFPSVRQMIQAYKNDNKQVTMIWDNGIMPQFSAPQKPSQTPENMPQLKLGTDGLDATISLILLRLIDTIH